MIQTTLFYPAKKQLKKDQPLFLLSVAVFPLLHRPAILLLRLLSTYEEPSEYSIPQDQVVISLVDKKYHFISLNTPQMQGLSTLQWVGSLRNGLWKAA